MSVIQIMHIANFFQLIENMGEGKSTEESNKNHNHLITIRKWQIEAVGKDRAT